MYYISRSTWELERYQTAKVKQRNNALQLTLESGKNNFLNECQHVLELQIGVKSMSADTKTSLRIIL